MCVIVAPHAWSPRNFPHSEEEANFLRWCGSPCGMHQILSKMPKVSACSAGTTSAGLLSPTA